jgi:hypothetical protein
MYDNNIDEKTLIVCIYVYAILYILFIVKVNAKIIVIFWVFKKLNEDGKKLVL